MTARKRGLGRGLDALLGGQEGDEAVGNLLEVPINMIQPNPAQPRRSLDQEALEELTASIRAQGLLQPLLVRQLEQNRFQLIAGERRWRAAQQAGLQYLPVHVREVSERQVAAMALIENIQREDLNTMEQARALQSLHDEYGLTHQQLADEVGKSRVTVTNLLRLTNLEPEVARLLEQGELEMGHARALLGASTGENGEKLSGREQTRLARQVVSRRLTVRQTEQLVRNLRQPTKPAARVTDADTRRLENRLSQHLGQPVAVRHSHKGKGRVVISYASLDELEAVMERLGCRDFE